MIKVPILFNNGSRINRDILNSTILDTIQLVLQTHKHEFVTDVKYLQNQEFQILTPDRTDLVTYIQDHNNYVLNTSNTYLGISPFYNLENIIEIFNISRNETYMVISMDSSSLTFMQPNEFVEIVKDVETSLYRITGYLAKTNVQDSIHFSQSSDYILNESNQFYVLKYIGNKTFSIYTIEISENNNFENLYTIISLIQNNSNIDLSLPEMYGVIKIGDLVVQQNVEYTIDDIHFSFGYKEYTDPNIDYIEFLNYADLLYFYVNRNPMSEHNHDTQYTKVLNSIYNNIIENGASLIELSNGKYQNLILTEDTEVTLRYQYNSQQDIVLKVIQDNIGNHTLSFISDDVIHWENRTPISNSQAQDSIDIYNIYYDGNEYYINIKQNY